MSKFSKGHRVLLPNGASSYVKQIVDNKVYLTNGEQYSDDKLNYPKPPIPICGNPNCGVSTTISENPSFGSGKLDDNGFWQKPCYACARHYEFNDPNGDFAWPFSEKYFAMQNVHDLKTKFKKMIIGLMCTTINMNIINDAVLFRFALTEIPGNSNDKLNLLAWRHNNREFLFSFEAKGIVILEDNLENLELKGHQQGFNCDLQDFFKEYESRIYNFDSFAKWKRIEVTPELELVLKYKIQVS